MIIDHFFNGSGRPGVPLVGSGAEGGRPLAAGRRCCCEVTSDRSGANAESSARPRVSVGQQKRLKQVVPGEFCSIGESPFGLAVMGCLLCFSHPLPKAVLLLCKVVQMSLCSLKGEGLIACLAHCDRASGYLRSSVSVPLGLSGSWLNKVRCNNASAFPTHLPCDQSL